MIAACLGGRAVSANDTYAKRRVVSERRPARSDPRRSRFNRPCAHGDAVGPSWQVACIIAARGLMAILRTFAISGGPFSTMLGCSRQLRESELVTELVN